MKKLACIVAIILCQGCDSGSNNATLEEIKQINQRIELLDNKISLIMDLAQKEASARRLEREGLNVRSLKIKE